MPELDLTPDSGGAPASHSAAPPPPAHLDHYDVLGRLGEGGMGEVYLARDRRLGRQVALKMLAGRFHSEAHLRERFLSEARAVSALEHPHVCRLYDVGEWEGRPYFTMERLRGETLRERLRRGPVGAEEVRRMGAQVAGALAAAHELGILHCDIKPSNLFLTTDAGAKVMDFGIARRLQTDFGSGGGAAGAASTASPAPPASDDSTVSGEWRAGDTPAGTPFYMSPEQVRGDELDGRADVFSLGAVLYEMASGRQPFQGKTIVEIYASILREQPAPLTLADTGLSAIIMRCLDKDRTARFGSAKELAQVLRGSLPLQPYPGPPARKPLWWLAGAAVALASAAGAWVYWGGTGLKLPQPSLSPLVSVAGDKDAPALSPSGDRVVFAWTGERGNNVDIYVKMVASGPPLRVTDNALTDTNPVWSPDGQRIAFLRTGSAGVSGENGYYVISPLGGQERKVARSYRAPILNGGSNLTWSPDGRELIYCDRLTPEGPPVMAAVNIESGQTRTLAEGKGYLANPLYSPDGTRLAYLRGPGFISHDLFVMDVRTAASRQLTHDLRSIGGLAWTADGASVVFSSNRLGLFSLWRVDARGGEPQPVAPAGTDAVAPSIAREGKRLAYLSRRVNINLWRYPLDTAAAAAAGAKPVPERLVSSTRISTEPDYSPDGQRIVFASERSGSWEIWTTRADGSQPLQLTNTPGQQSASPRWSPDSKWIVFDSRFEGHADLAIIAAQGEGFKRLTTAGSDEFLPRFSRDGASIYFMSNRSGSTQLWKMPAPGHAAAEPLQITTRGLADAVESEDGQFLYIARQSKLWRMPVNAREEHGLEEVLERAFWRDFSLVPGGVIFARNWTNLMQSIERYDLAAKQTKPLFEIGPRPNLYGPFVISPDRKWLLTDRVDQQNMEIMLVENFR
ncbi:MAG: serine/threonine-protein kinase [Bryobacterales bacterium]|nr:serine/threonine-protein kinase [Bryobacterales bacterium]